MIFFVRNTLYRSFLKILKFEAEPQGLFTVRESPAACTAAGYSLVVDKRQLK